MLVGIVSLGCSKNLVESELAMKYLKRHGHSFTSDPKKAEAIIVNTCGFINDAKEESINTILQMADYKEFRCKKLIVMGCLATRYRDDLPDLMPEVDRFITINEYNHLDEILSEELGTEKLQDCDLLLATNPWTAYLKIAEGCDNMCAFCAIPYIRGHYRSVPMEEILEQAKIMEAHGVKELNLIAQDTTKYGIDLYHELKLEQLLEELNKMNFHWIRILYMYPDELTDSLIETMNRLDKVLPYFDIPVQHGSDELLHKMLRKSNVSRLRAIVKKIRTTCDDATLRTTVIVGFPSETKEDYKKLLDFVSETRWDHLGAFKYSLEEDTRAYDMHPRIADRVSQSRYDRLMKLQQKITIENAQRFIGTIQEVLIEKYDAINKLYYGRSRHNAPDGIDGLVKVASEKDIELGSFVNVEITGVSGYDMEGIRVDQ